MKPVAPALFLPVFLAAAFVWAAEPIAVTVRTRNWQGYSFETVIDENGRYVKKFRKDGGPDMADAPLIKHGGVSEANLEHLSKIIDRSGFLSLKDDMVLKEPSPGPPDGRFEGEITVRRGESSKSVRFGPYVESIPEPVTAVLNEVARLTQEDL